MKTEYSRKIGKYSVSISKEGGVSIVGDYGSNYGTIYPHKIEQYKEGKRHNYLPHLYVASVSLFGMEWGYGLTKTVKDYINQSILKLYS